MTQLIKTQIINHQGILYRGDATAISSQNAHGKFDVLPGHINFITTIEKHLILHLPDHSTKEFPVSRGLLFINQNAIQAYLGL